MESMILFRRVVIVRIIFSVEDCKVEEVVMDLWRMERVVERQ